MVGKNLRFFKRIRSSFKLLYTLVSLNIFLFLIVYHRLIIITPFLRSTIIPKINIKLSQTISSICPIPELDPWDQTIAKSLRIPPLYRCPTKKKNLIQVVNSTQLLIDQVANYTSYESSITHCIYLKIQRNSEEKFFRDWSYTLSEAILIRNGRSQPILDADFVLTRCFNNRKGFFQGEIFCGYKCSKNDSKYSNDSHLVYEYVHPIIRIKKPAISSKKKFSHPSVLIFILDAVSDLQAQRALPRTLNYLKSLGLYTFHRHSIVGDGTFENLVPMLFGETGEKLLIPNTNDRRYKFSITETQVDSKTNKTRQVKKTVYYPGPFDNYKFIAKNFSKLNYTTYFSEEWRESAFFNLKNGFRQAPTDFYLRQYWLALYETLSYNSFTGNSNPKPCYLDKLLHFLTLDWLRDFLSIHHRTFDHPTFGIMKMNEMSHDYLERLFWIDNDLESFFQNLVERHLLDNTIVIFCGDHGHRQHALRLTRIGSFEVKLPFYSMLLPETFKKNFPQAAKNLEKNQEKLTSWWDVYETLADILKMVEDPVRMNWKATTPGISLFRPIPERNCSMAGISEKFCPCSFSKPVHPSLSIVKKLTETSIDYINNNKLKMHQHLCHILQLKSILRAEVEEFKSKTEINANFTQLYTILFEVLPSDAIFESNLLYNEKTGDIELQGEILRINLYGQTSACIKDKYELRSFCYCKSYHQKYRAEYFRRKL